MQQSSGGGLFHQSSVISLVLDEPTTKVFLHSYWRSKGERKDRGNSSQKGMKNIQCSGKKAVSKTTSVFTVLTWISELSVKGWIANVFNLQVVQLLATTLSWAVTAQKQLWRVPSGMHKVGLGPQAILCPPLF